MLLILPAEHKVDWRRPPIMTLALITLCVTIFIIGQDKDVSRLEQAIKAYTEAGLHKLEGPELNTYLLRRIRVEKAPLEPLRQSLAPAMKRQDWAQLAPVMLTDLAFYTYLRAEGERFWAPQTYAKWLDIRAQINHQYIEQLSANAAGLIPARIQIADLLTYPFLHSDWGHLLSNMVFLFLLGYAFEHVLGKLWLLGTFVLTGALAGLFWLPFANEAWRPLIGASGAISGLMGLYVGLYRLRHIRFFYMIGPYFNYFRAPALLIFPLWLTKEIAAYIAEPDAQVAYMAHAGGLLSGLLVSLYFTRLRPRDVPRAEQDDASRAKLNKALSDALDALSEARFAQALDRLWHLFEKSPDLPQLEKPLMALLLKRPDDPRYDIWLTRQVQTQIQSGALKDCLRLLARIATERPETCRTLILQVFNRALAEGQTEQAEKAYTLLLQTRPPALMVEEASHTLISRLHDLGLSMKASHYEKRLADRHRTFE